MRGNGIHGGRGAPSNYWSPSSQPQWLVFASRVCKCELSTGVLWVRWHGLAIKCTDVGDMSQEGKIRGFLVSVLGQAEGQSEERGSKWKGWPRQSLCGWTGSAWWLWVQPGDVGLEALSSMALALSPFS